MFIQVDVVAFNACTQPLNLWNYKRLFDQRPRQLLMNQHRYVVLPMLRIDQTGLKLGITGLSVVG